MMMGSMDLDYCVFINIGLWLELNLMMKTSTMISPYLFPLINDMTIPLGGQKSKDIAQNIFLAANYLGILSSRYRSFGFTKCS